VQDRTWQLRERCGLAAFQFRGHSCPGKLVLGLRVRSATGEKLTLKASVVRNFLRVVDAFPYVIPYLVGAIAVWSDGSLGLDPVPNERRLRRRLGDRAARTIVTYR
jgi:uncharacterized RDD family membrane protein YckC